MDNPYAFYGHSTLRGWFLYDQPNHYWGFIKFSGAAHTHLSITGLWYYRMSLWAIIKYSTIDNIYANNSRASSNLILMINQNSGDRCLVLMKLNQIPLLYFLMGCIMLFLFDQSTFIYILSQSTPSPLDVLIRLLPG